MPDPEMDPLIKEVTCAYVEGEHHFEIVLSRANLNHLLAGCPHADCLIGRTREGLSFRLFSGPGAMPKSFRFAGDGYYSSIGRPGEPLPPNFTKEEFDRLAEKSDQGLIDAIKNSKEIPMEMQTDRGTDNVGFVKIRIEE
jgi:hypothetical protein